MLSFATATVPVVSPPHVLDDNACWDAVARRDQAMDGVFVCAVRTTGVYCRPSCAGRPLRKNVAFYQTAEAARLAGFRPCKRCRPDDIAPDRKRSIEARIASFDWATLAAELDAQGCATTGPLLTAEECAALTGAYAADNLFRSRIVMARHGFGRGEYKYFAYPLPKTVASLRTALYSPLALIANRWNEAMNITVRYPDAHQQFLARCHDAGQTKPTPLLLQYGAGDYNCLHQDIFGENVFPLQVAFLLSRPGADFTGGEFVLSEQRPRAQSRAEVVLLQQGEGVIFPVHHRPAQGMRRAYRVNMRHGVSRLRTGRRNSLGVIFHDAR